MSVVAAGGGLVVALALAVVKALATDEVRGRVQRRSAASVEATIASLPPELQDEWGEEWRSELASVSSMPITAARFARGLRKTALQLVGEDPLAAKPSTARPTTSRNGGGMPFLRRLAIVSGAIGLSVGLIGDPRAGVMTGVATFAVGLGLLVAGIIYVLVEYNKGG